MEKQDIKNDRFTQEKDFGIIPLGEGTKDSPYLIANAAQLDWFRDKVNGGDNSICGALVSDITYNQGKDVAGYDGKSSNDFVPFTPIAPDLTGYSGTFDGCGNTISGLYVNVRDNQWCGLFGNVADGGVVKDVTIRNSYISMGPTRVSSVYLGGIAGSCVDGIISGCDVRATINMRSDFSGIKFSDINCGVVVGYTKGTTMVTDCAANGSVNVDGTAIGNIHCGGIVGYMFGAVTVRGCATGSSVAVGGTATFSTFCGGIAGYAFSAGTITDCTMHGDVSVGSTASSIFCGGIAGYTLGVVTVRDCRMKGNVDVSGKTTFSIHCGGIAGYAFHTSTVTYCTTSGDVDVSGTATFSIHCGGIVGDLDGSSIVKGCTCLRSVDVSGTALSISREDIVGYVFDVDTTPDDTADGSAGVGDTMSSVIYREEA